MSSYQIIKLYTKVVVSILSLLSEAAFSGTQHDLVVITNVNPSFEVREKATLGFGDNALIDSNVVKLKLNLFNKSSKHPTSYLVAG